MSAKRENAGVGGGAVDYGTFYDRFTRSTVIVDPEDVPGFSEGKVQMRPERILDTKSIITLAKRLGYSPGEIAERLSVDSATLYRWREKDIMPGEASWAKLVALRDELLSGMQSSRTTMHDLSPDQLQNTAKFPENPGNPCPQPAAEPDAAAPSNKYLDIDLSNMQHSEKNTEAKCDEPLPIAEPNCGKCPLKGKTRVRGEGRSSERA